MTDPLVAQTRRTELNEIFVGILGTRHVYFQPPPNIQMQYPCIVYSRDYSYVAHADNLPYHITKRWQVTVIDSNPDSTIGDAIEALPQCSFIRHFETSKLHHYVYNLYF